MKKYEKITNDIILKIEEDIFKEGDQIYTEKQIKDIYNVSSTTAVRVLNDLEASGYIFRVQGKGSFVSKSLVNKKVFFTEKNNFSKYVSQGTEEKVKIISVNIIQDVEINKKLKIRTSSKVLEVIRVKYIGDIAWAHQTNYIPIKYLPNLDVSDKNNFLELAKMIRLKYNIDIHKESIKEYIMVNVAPPKDVADYIAYNGEPCFEFDRYTRFFDKTIFEYVKIYINYKFYQITIRS